MEQHYHNTAFEDLIKEKADQYKMYPSEKTWKGVERSLRSRRKWYWTGFVILLSGISYLAITELMAPAAPRTVKTSLPLPASSTVPVISQLTPFSSDLSNNHNNAPVPPAEQEAVLSDVMIEDSGNITAAFEIPLSVFGPAALTGMKPDGKGSLLIKGLQPLANNEQYNIELSWPVEAPVTSPARTITRPAQGRQFSRFPGIYPEENKNYVNWLHEQAALGLKTPSAKTRHIRWQLAFSPTVNYRKLTGGKNARFNSDISNIPMALRIPGDVSSLVNHSPALGFEMGTHGLLSLTKALTLKGGIQFNYSKYDITAYKGPEELATISLNSSIGTGSNTLVSYTDLRNFGGSSVSELKNQYFQIAVPVGLELKVFGNDKLQFNIAGTLQPTYLLNKNTYLITTDLKNYTKAPSLVNRWNLNAGAEAFISYNRGGVKWQVGPQFRYQLFSSYNKAYPIKEYLTEYGIKIGVTKTIR